MSKKGRITDTWICCPLFTKLWRMEYRQTFQPLISIHTSYRKKCSGFNIQNQYLFTSFVYISHLSVHTCRSSVNEICIFLWNVLIFLSILACIWMFLLSLNCLNIFQGFRYVSVSISPLSHAKQNLKQI